MLETHSLLYDLGGMRALLVLLLQSVGGKLVIHPGDLDAVDDWAIVETLTEGTYELQLLPTVGIVKGSDSLQ